MIYSRSFEDHLLHIEEILDRAIIEHEITT
jgi:hypothetical protein